MSVLSNTDTSYINDMNYGYCPLQYLMKFHKVVFCFVLTFLEKCCNNNVTLGKVNM